MMLTVVFLLICSDVFIAEASVDKENNSKVIGESANENLKNISDNTTDIFYRTDSNKFYISRILKNWEYAARSCESFGMALISITSQKDLLKLNKLLFVNNLEPTDDKTGYWLSGHHTQLGKFNWTSVNKQIDCWGWLPNEPGNRYSRQLENCVELKKQDDLVRFGWNNLHCDEYRRFICEKLVFDKDSLVDRQEDEEVIEPQDTSCYKLRIPYFPRIG